MVMDGRRPPPDELISLYQAQVAREGYTTALGAAGGISIKDAGLIGFGVDSFKSMTLQIYPGDERKVDTADITSFDNAAGEIFVSGGMKGGQVPAHVPYKVLTQRPSIAEIHGVFVVTISAPIVVAPDTIEDLSLSISTVEGIPAAANLTAGTITITRVRAGAEVIIINGLGCAKANGRIFYAYTFPSAGADWLDGDEYKAVFSGQAVAVGATTYALSDQRCKGIVANILALTVIANGIFSIEVSAPETVEPDTNEDLSLSISTALGIPLAATLAAGTITITRVRAGVETVIVNALGCAKTDGRIFYAYTFPSAGAAWQAGDEYKAVFSGQAVTIYPLSDIRCKGRVSRETAIAASKNIVCQATLDEHCDVDQGANKLFAFVSIMNISGDADLVLVAEITTPPVIEIMRFRAGTDVNWTPIGAAVPMTPANGYVYHTYDFPSASWANGDRVQASMQGGVVTIAGQTFFMPSEFRYAVVGSKLAGLPGTNGALAAAWGDGAAHNLVTIGAPLLRAKLHLLIIDISALVGNISIRLYTDVNGAPQRIYPIPANMTFSVVNDAPAIPVVNSTMGLRNALLVTIQSDNVLDNAANVGWEYLLEAM